ncbi:hypothetical protein V3C10_19830 [[Clostridium] symbiosum]|uniref:type II restriction enzyme n=1 Tax=Clostridium symbiosum TaxID=1512 RepID=UPI001D073D9E|nr:hypothetical protein [[Clostridium] symbiosum]MCB6609020.1 hypothetical protein [[Clostridium] symbiosum]MCB6930445.1 hypothetical protein [[Clostridium] symbiosum]
MSLIDDKWKLLFDRYEIEKKVSESGPFCITADQIREYKEPRLMTKFDTRESLPSVFGSRLGILPVTRGSYVIGEFDLYADFPEAGDGVSGKRPGKVKKAAIPDYYETIDINDIRSEAGAINVMGISGILDDFLGGAGFKQTVSGRMASGNFSFQVNPVKSAAKAGGWQLTVNNSQVEIDGGFEDRDTFAVIEGKNVVHSNFLVRQLYYPYRLWSGKLAKPVRPVFMVYSNNIFRLMEYEFTDPFCYNSIRLIREGQYSLEDTDISAADLRDAWERTAVKPEPQVTFIQADSFEKVISLVEHLNESPLTPAEIAEVFGFRERQSDYYFNACRYLGLAVKEKDEDRTVRVTISPQGKKLLKLNYKARQIRYVELILEHGIFHELFETVMRSGEIPDKKYIEKKILEQNLCSSNVAGRRASSVSGWLKWMTGLVQQN